MVKLNQSSRLLQAVQYRNERDISLQYLAGLIDGEGCIDFSNPGKDRDWETI